MKKTATIIKQMLAIHTVDSVPGLYYIDDVFSAADCGTIVKNLDACQRWTPLTGSKNSRMVQHYGYIYDYTSGKVDQKCDPIPNFLTPMRDVLQYICSELKLMDEKYEFNQCIVNNYEPGQGISRHVDAAAYGHVIGCYTLGSGATMMFTSPNSETHAVYVQPGSLYLMVGDKNTLNARYDWSHQMDGRKSDVVNGKRVPRGRRISVTFRNV